ncbi:putative transcription factor & chromatin remodeling ARID family [Helianthus annuus]|uniref:Transcription factor & chromatin remodeling ARID family n=1 Tax=Helianthus annuus TaxID=4232 RepID=A0A9K3JQB8_HELAN|nr:putative transcription factor & chromatin remodeling ARID family [Helianthus annuus]
MILQAMKFNEFQDCKALLDMLEDVEYVSKYRYDLEIKFDMMLEWFIRTKLGITTSPILAYASDKRKVNLLELYMVVKREGGNRNVTSNNLWVVVAKDMGFDYQDGEFMRLMYTMYLDVLVYYYKFKSTQQEVFKRETVKNEENKRQSWSYNDKQETIADRKKRSSSAGCIPE